MTADEKQKQRPTFTYRQFNTKACINRGTLLLFDYLFLAGCGYGISEEFQCLCFWEYSIMVQTTGVKLVVGLIDFTWIWD